MTRVLGASLKGIRNLYLSRYSTTPAGLADLHTLARVFTNRVGTLHSTVLSSSSTGLGSTATAEVRHSD